MAKSKDVCRLTAMQIESGENLPPRLQEIGKQIEARVVKVAMYQGKAIDMFDSIGRLLDEAKEFCDTSGFDAFKRTCCPTLGKTRAYEMLAIASGKKALEDVRAEIRERVRKHRANKTGRRHSVTVTEKSGPDVAEGAPAELASSDAAGIVPDQTPEAAKSRNATAKDDASLDISEGILDLISKTRGQKPERFAATYVQADDLAELGKFFTDLANFKKRSAVRGNDTVSPEQSAADMRA
jgi:hypothetical protein